MQIGGKALYNLLRLQWAEDPTGEVQPWQIEDYRLLSTAELFRRLQELQINLNEDRFRAHAATVEGPEELTEHLWIGPEDAQAQDRAYLLLFELWRRLAVDRKTLSIFCDEMDHQIEHYNKTKEPDDEGVQKIVVELEDILDTSIDAGATPAEAFTAVAQGCAHSLESFLYDYIARQIESGNDTYASELLDGFYEYVPEKKWFDLLRARLFAAANPEEGDKLLARLIEEEGGFDFFAELASHLIPVGDESLFIEAVQRALPLMETEGDFQELLALAEDYWRCLDHDEKEKAMKALLSARSKNPLSMPINHADPAIRAFRDYLG